MNTALEFAIFPTPIGHCAIVWGAQGVKGVFLPHRSAEKLMSLVGQKFVGAREVEPPDPMRSAIDDMAALMSGTLCDLKNVELDMSGIPEFPRRVYERAREIPPGQVMTYGELAAALHAKDAARAVGQALGANPFPIIVPCHRVLAADGKWGGFSAPGGLATKMKLLNIERAQLKNAPTLFAHLPLSVRR